MSMAAPSLRAVPQTYRGLRAVPQTYRGVRFRSTLEADWAATLDSLDIAWEYEPEAVQLPSGEFYRPDFYLPECTTWLEVKGPHDERIDKVRELGEAAKHYPECTRNPPALRLLAYSDEQWSAYGRILAAAPDGPTRVSVERREPMGAMRQRMRDTGRLTRRRTLQTARLRRGVLLSADTLAALGSISPVGALPKCCDSYLRPWRLVIIGRPARGGAAVWESPQGFGVWLLGCGTCGGATFQPRVQSTCRRCHVELDEPTWDVGGIWQFVRAPRPS